MDKPKVNLQGKCVCEKLSNVADWFVMLPDGQVVMAGGREAAEARCRKWFKRHIAPDQINVGVIEWREPGFYASQQVEQ